MYDLYVFAFIKHLLAKFTVIILVVYYSLDSSLYNHLRAQQARETSRVNRAP